MVQPTTTFATNALDSDDKDLNLDDPFIGLLGQGSRRDDLWLGKTVPRYTSYPPATAFHENVTAQDYMATLAALPEHEPLSLYMHIPFCQALCLYCGCNTTATKQHDRVSHYLELLLREIDNVAHASSSARRIGRIHFGGGSPNIMSEKDWGLVFAALTRRFDLSSTKEIAVELDPRLLTKAQARAMRIIGVNRASLGVQDFDLDVQAAIGRIQPYQQVAEAYHMLRDVNVKSINFDLLYGLPRQSPRSMTETAQLVADLRPERISLFSYAHVPQAKKHQKALEQYILPGPYAALALERAARAVFVEAGYVEIGMDHFALPEDPLAMALENKTLRRNFQGYTNDFSQTLVGLGASSIGQTTNKFFQNARTVEDYQARLVGSGFATTRGLTLSSEDKVRGAIIEQLMCYLSVNLEQVCRQYSYSPSMFSAELDALKLFEEQGLVKREGYKISLDVPHRMAVRVIASLFDQTQRAADAPVSRVV